MLKVHFIKTFFPIKKCFLDKSLLDSGVPVSAARGLECFSTARAALTLQNLVVEAQAEQPRRSHRQRQGLGLQSCR